MDRDTMEYCTSVESRHKCERYGMRVWRTGDDADCECTSSTTSTTTTTMATTDGPNGCCHPNKALWPPIWEEECSDVESEEECVAWVSERGCPPVEFQFFFVLSVTDERHWCNEEKCDGTSNHGAVSAINISDREPFGADVVPNHRHSYRADNESNDGIADRTNASAVQVADAEPHNLRLLVCTFFLCLQQCLMRF